MLVFIQFTLVSLFLVTAQVSSQNFYPPHITCYMNYEYEETRSRPQNVMLGHHYHKTESTQYQTTDNELCSKVGCTCFSYQNVCSYSTPGSNHVSQCTDADRQNGVIKWHRGWTSLAKCDEMRQQPQTYRNLTCCQTDRCNDQPGKVIKFMDIPEGARIQEFNGQPFPQLLPVSHALPHRHDSYGYPSTQPVPVSHPPPQRYDSYNQQFPQPVSVSNKPSQQYNSYNPQSPQPVLVSHKPPQQYDSYGHQSPQALSVTSTSTVRHNTYVRRATTPPASDTYKPSEGYDRSLSSNTSLLFSSVSNWMIFLSLVCYLLIMV